MKSFTSGLMNLLEFLGDIGINAPLAIQHMSSIVAELVKAGVIPFDFLHLPQYFQSDQKAANFVAEVIRKIGCNATGSDE